MLNDLKYSLDSIINKYSTLNPWTNVYGLARSVLAFSLLLTLIFSGFDNLFPKVNGELLKQQIFDIEKLSIFYLFNDNMIIAYWICIAILIIVISGILPQITSFLHWWVALSYTFSGIIIEGGDQISSILTLLIIPLALTDNRINHWHKPKIRENKKLKLFVWSCYAIITLQIGIIYFHAGVAKIFVTEWQNGTAVYYWFTHNIFGVSDSLINLTYFLLSSKIVVISITWGTILFELTLFSWLFIKRNNWNWKLLFIMAFLFHFLIALIHGLVSFGLTMTAASILYFFPKNINIKL
ncbi:MAG: hypothetical protein HKP59_09130 [Lutibacter sp.]|uniref:sporulation-delaying protein SdpB family protein n=1 Tax=Lutibacter sp. TaxID=1925666 RepID=UPI0018221BA7|nr:sporulation-delaying protein SdpB family protein [Lutibacter sp.]MBT8317780.1 hypothetical protein [Lutibacter sp.]NNJ58638.1 hypothetical protein [Lutibacter sp.]